MRQSTQAVKIHSAIRVKTKRNLQNMHQFRNDQYLRDSIKTIVKQVDQLWSTEMMVSSLRLPRSSMTVPSFLALPTPEAEEDILVS